MNLNWYVKDESVEREGYICLAIREEQSHRLICDMSDYPDDVPGFVERVKEEANIIAGSPALLEACKEAIAWHEKMNASDNVYDIGFPGDIATLLYDAIASAEGRIENSYGGIVES